MTDPDDFGPPYVWRDGKLVSKCVAPSKWVTGVIRDDMPATLHMADGKHYDSKSRFRAVTKAHGCCEVGDQRDYGLKRTFVPTLDKRQRRDDIGRAIYQLRNGQRP